MIEKNTSQLIIEELAKDCNKCGHCCKFGSGIVLKNEVPKIANAINMKEEKFVSEYLDDFEYYGTSHKKLKQIKDKKLPHGRCVFLSEENQCQIQNVKPLYCRIGNCNKYGDELLQWFHLNFSVDQHNPESIRAWKIYTDNKEVINGGKVQDIVDDEEILKKIMNYDILK
ncbi:YkgJ family cysteine cluster protein [Candidatus Woesearchaeota archaeon]|nr:YkgJ family cysteine cluster protein [Candidatus Woesearchaeota archaeon]